MRMGRITTARLLLLLSMQLRMRIGHQDGVLKALVCWWSYEDMA